MSEQREQTGPYKITLVTPQELTEAVHLYRQWGTSVRFLFDGLRKQLTPEQESFFGQMIDNVLSYTPKTIEETAKAKFAAPQPEPPTSEPPATTEAPRTYSSVMEMVEAISEPAFTLEFAKQQVDTAESEVAALRKELAKYARFDEAISWAWQAYDDIREHFNDDGTLKGDGKWRLTELNKRAKELFERIHQCIGCDAKPKDAALTAARETIERQAKELAEAHDKDAHWVGVTQELLRGVSAEFQAKLTAAEAQVTELRAEIERLRKSCDLSKVFQEPVTRISTT